MTGFGEAPGDPSGRDEVPAEVIARAKGLFPATKRRMAVLVFDSLLDSESNPDDYQLRFEYPLGTVMVAVTSGPAGARVTGQASPLAKRAELHVEGDGTVAATMVEDGQFRFGPVRHGLIRIHIEGSDQDGGVWTEWFRV